MKPSIKYLEDAFARIDGAHRADLSQRKTALEVEVSHMEFDSSATAPEHVAVARFGFNQAMSRTLSIIKTTLGEQSPSTCRMDELETTGAITISRSEGGHYVINDIDGRHIYETRDHAIGYISDRLEYQTKRIQDFKANPSRYAVSRAVYMKM